MLTDFVEAVVVGAGVVGLAIARALAMDGREVIVLEAADAIGTETSSRNSEVIHAGIYYPADSLKASLCVRGKSQLYEFAASHGIEHQRAGKLIVATASDEIEVLKGLRNKGRRNGVDDLEMLTESEARALEPNLTCVAALLSPSTGIIDSHGLMLALQGDAESNGAAIAFLTQLTHAQIGDGQQILKLLNQDGNHTELACRTLINATGLRAQATARLIDGFDPACIPRRYLAKGSYFSYRGPAPFTRLIYPVPGTGSLGLHYTLDLGGQPRFGPDHEVVDSIDYDVDATRADQFYAAIRKYFPALPEESLAPAYAGIRPKVQAPGEPMQDFVIQDWRTHGCPGLINLFGIESPGLTSCLALADHVLALLNRANAP